MKKKNGKLLSLVLMLCMLCSLIPAGVVTVYASPASSVNVGGVGLSNSKPYYVNGEAAEEGTLGSGGCTAHFDADTGTLTLNGIDLDGGIGRVMGDLEIILMGDNTITSTGNGIESFSGNLSFSGEGSLDIYSSRRGITTEYAITVDECSLSVESDSIAVVGGAGVTINSGSVTAKGSTYGMDCYSSKNGVITINGGTVIAEGSPAFGKEVVVSADCKYRESNSGEYTNVSSSMEWDGDYYEIITGTTPSTAEGIFAGRYSHNQVFETRRIPALPTVVGADFEVYRFDVPYDAVNRVQFEQDEVEGKIFYFKKSGVTGAPFAFYMADDAEGTNERAVSVSGNIYALAKEGFLFVNYDADYGYFIANESACQYGGSLKYVPDILGPLTLDEANDYNDANDTPQIGYNAYAIWVGGVQVTSENADNILSDDLVNDGKVSYDTATKTLILDGVNIADVYNGRYTICADRSLNIKLMGDNTLSSLAGQYGDYAVYTTGKLVFSGSGTLYATGYYGAVYAEGGLDVSAFNVLGDWEEEAEISSLTTPVIGENYIETVNGFECCTVYFEQPHIHNNTTYAAWTETDSLPTVAGNYYLKNDVTISSTWEAPEGTTGICLNGHKIISGIVNSNFSVYVDSGNTLNLYDCSDEKTGAVCASDEDAETETPGMYVEYNGTLNLYGGKIYGFSLETFGIMNYGTFNMYGGAITGNRAYAGVLNDGVFNMYGGSISDNEVLYGGMYNEGTATFGGSAEISGNKELIYDETEGFIIGDNRNLVIRKGSAIAIGEQGFTQGASIGVTVWDNNKGKPATGAVTGENDNDITAYFNSDSADYIVTNGENNKVMISVPPVYIDVPDGWEGEGTISAPWIIDTVQEFMDMATCVSSNALTEEGGKAYASAHYRLGANISLDPNANWVPIGTNSMDNIPFMGSFDGAGYTVSNMTMNSSESPDELGLFYYVGPGAIVKNLTLSDVSVTGRWNLSGIAVNCGGTIDNCHVISGTICGVSEIGGIVSFVGSEGIIRNCSNAADITYPPDSLSASDFAGIASYSFGATIDNCYNTGSITGKGRLAGIVSWQDEGSVTRNCFNAGTISGGSSIGGIVGYVNNSGYYLHNTKSEVYNCYYVRNSGASSVYGHSNKGTVSYCDSFTGADDTVSYKGSELSLVDALNSWVELQNSTDYLKWQVLSGINNGYPVFAQPHTHGVVTFTALDEAGGALTSGNYYLADNADATDNIIIESDAEVTICLNGKTLDMGSYNITVLGSLNICDCQETEGTITGDIIGSSNGLIVNDGGTVIITGGNIENTGTAAAAVKSDSGTIKISGGNIEGSTGVSNASSSVVEISGNATIKGKASSAVANYGTLKLTGGNITSTISHGIQNFRGTVDMSGGSVTTNSASGFGIYNSGGTVNLSAGSISAPNTYAIRTSDVNISGYSEGKVYISGTPVVSGNDETYSDIYMYSGKIYAISADSTPVPYSGNELTVSVGNPAASMVVIGSVNSSNKDKFTLVNTSGYILQQSGDNLVLDYSHKHQGVSGGFAELTAPGGALTSGNYYLVDNATATGNITIASGQEVTICLNGKTLDVGNYNIDNRGTLTICDCQGAEGTIETPNKNSKGILYNIGTLTINAGNVKYTGTESYAYSIYNSGGNTTVNGGNIDGLIKNYATFTLNGGKLTNSGEYSVIENSDGITIVNGGEIENDYLGIFNYCGILHVKGGSITSTDSPAITNYDGYTFLSGAPEITGNETESADINQHYSDYAFVYAHSADGTEAYSGGNLTVEFDSAYGYAVGNVAIAGVDNSTAQKFTLLGNETYTLERDTIADPNSMAGGEIDILAVALKHVHDYKTKYNETHHWSECECDDVKDETVHTFVDGFCSCGVHKHEDGIVFMPWTSSAIMPSSAGNYYLANNVTLADNWVTAGGTTNLCLNGLTIGSANKHIHPSGTFNIYDCSSAGTGEIKSTNNYAILNSTATTTIYGGNIISTNNVGIHCSAVGGTLTVLGGSITGTTAIKNSYGIVNIKGGKVTCENGYAIENYDGDVYISGTPEISGVDSEIMHKYSTYCHIHASDISGTLFYAGTQEIRIGLYEDRYYVAGNAIVRDFNNTNKDKFVLVGNADYKFAQGTAIDGNTYDPYDALVVAYAHEHTWSTEWSEDANGHWHECTTPDCYITDYSAVTDEGCAYETHSAPADDNDCTSDIKCEICEYVFEEGNADHSYIYTAEDNIITEKCSVSGCTAHTESAVVTAPTGTLTYDGMEKTATIEYSDNWKGGTLDIVYNDNVNAGNVTATITKYEAMAVVNYEIIKAIVNEPAIQSKVYNGNGQIADVPADSLYVVAENNGGEDVGVYDVKLTLAESDNYKWFTTAEATVILDFEITKATNTFTVAPAIENWTYGETASEPSGTATFGDVIFKYYDSGQQELDGRPDNAGSYYMKAFVDAGLPGMRTITTNYDAISSDFVAFTIAKASPVIDALPTAERITIGSTLSQSALTGGVVTGVNGQELSGTFTWADGSEQMNTVTIASRSVVFNPTDSTNYNSITAGDVDVTVYRESSGGGGVTRYLVKFNTNGGESMESVYVKKNERLQEPDEPVWDGYVFKGWFADKQLEIPYNFTYPVTRNITLYAAWELAEELPPEPDTPTGPEKKNPFIDVNETDWFYEEVMAAFAAGYISGTSKNTFTPGGSITRGMFVTMIWRAEGSPEGGEHTFLDVAGGEYYEEAVAWGSENGIILGFSETEYAPEREITREQMAAILFRYAAFKGMDLVTLQENLLEFKDSHEITPYAVPALNWAVEIGIISGRPGGILDPTGNATRAEATAMLMRFLGK